MKEIIAEEVTGLMVEKRIIIDGKKVRRLFMNGYPDCIYSSKDVGITYVCTHCEGRLKRE
jgi:aminopeptidase N